jgi:hypothetical protein
VSAPGVEPDADRLPRLRTATASAPTVRSGRGRARDEVGIDYVLPDVFAATRG